MVPEFPNCSLCPSPFLCAGHIIDLGPEGGERGGIVVIQGTVSDIMASPVSHTVKFLKRKLLKEGEPVPFIRGASLLPDGLER